MAALLTPDPDELTAAYTAGASIKALAKAHDVGAKRMRGWLLAAGVTIRPQGDNGRRARPKPNRPAQPTQPRRSPGSIQATVTVLDPDTWTLEQWRQFHARADEYATPPAPRCVAPDTP